jgi:hypothetical protein
MKLAALIVALLLAVPVPASERVAAPPATWVSGVRLDVSGEAGEDPYVAILMTVATGKSAAQSQTASGYGTIRLTLNPEEARALGQALEAWADDPTAGTLFVRTR